MVMTKGKSAADDLVSSIWWLVSGKKPGLIIWKS
jgi:hypothetical protein